MNSRVLIYLNIITSKNFYTRLLAHSVLLFNNIFYTLYYVVNNPNWIKIDKKVEGLVSLQEGVFLYRAILKTKIHPSPNIIEVGAFKGKSTTFLSLGAKRAGKRIKCFELFSGLPVADPILDAHYWKGALSSTVDEFTSNVQTYGCSSFVDLKEGDARETMLPTIGGSGFCMAFLDVDVYEVTKDLLGKLLCVAKGKEVIFVHDTHSPGIRKAIEESILLSGKPIKRTQPNFDVAKIEVIKIG